MMHALSSLLKPNLEVRERMKIGFTYFIFNVLILFCFFLSYFFSSNIAATTDITGYVYYMIAALGQAATLCSILYLFIYLPLIYWKYTRKYSYIIFLAFCFLLDIIAYFNGIVFQLYKFHINGFILNLIFSPQAGEVLVFNSKLIIRVGMIITLSLAVFIALAVLIWKHSHFFSKKYIRIWSFILLGAIFISHIAHAYANAANQASIQYVASCLPQFYPLTANSLMNKLGVIKTENTHDYFNEKSSNTGVCYPLHPIQYSDSATNKNIIYIIIDSWNPKAFNETTMPNIWRFAQRAQVFNKHLSACNCTKGSIFSMFFGASYTYWKDFEIAGLQPTFLKALQKQEYEIQLFPSASLTEPPLYQVIFNCIPDARTETKGDTPFDRDSQITTDFINYINTRSHSENQKPLFTFLFYDLLHAIEIPVAYQKFQPSWEYADYLKLNNSIDSTPFFNLYRNCCQYVDSLVGNVLHSIEEAGLLENSIVMITGDHGQEFNENKKNYWGHNSNFSMAQLHIPMIYFTPDQEYKKYNHMTTHYDITPTIMKQELGVLNPVADYSMGQLLTDSIREPYFLVGDRNNYAFRINDLIYEKKLAGQIIITDSLLNPTNERVNANVLLKAIQYKNQFMK